ncbi:Prefoldin subunit family protein [Theileria parva strain Muguga]|uniref:Prefoldin subunit 3 n=1 Tax=Theileria parva TaxID=5875 RepID=Q4N793_THEPA|nr:Prefoldin subunit family protein [Theileria parva strain Muguga]EAN34165.1 Prefoldin subunit family protein [Theileria parva strain Muguga]|eukprot:XP_766448.1 prefoldin subunit 3 [Theileria parva strain Muguga]
MSYLEFISTNESKSNVPEAKFIDCMEKFVGERNSAELTQVAKELLAKYRFMEKNSTAKMGLIKDKLPELKDAIYTLEKLKKKKESGDKSDVITYFKISDTLYSEARIPYTESAFLWLGANTMVEYPIDDAIKLLTDQHNGIEQLIQEMDVELDWIKRQITCTEITVARLHNFTVMRNAANQQKPEPVN